MWIQRSILTAAIKAVAKLVASFIVGYVVTKKGIITQNALTVMSRLLYRVFLPCLLFVNVTRTIASTNQGVEKLFILPASSALLIFFGIMIGKVMERIVCLEPGSPDSRELRVCSAFGNAGTLPVLFMDAIFGSAGDEKAVSTAIAYISFYLLGWNLVFWTKGYMMLTGPLQRAPALQAPESDAELPSSSSPLIKKETPAFHRKVAEGFRRIMEHPNTEKVLSPPGLSCLAGIVVGACPGTTSLLVSRDAPFSPLLDALEGIGSGLVPVSVLVLAGSLADPQGASEPTAATEGAGRRSVFYRKVLAIMVSRFLAMPLISAGMLLAGFRAGIIPYEKLLWIVLLLQGFMPPAQSSVIVLQMEESPGLAASMAKTMTVAYLLSAVPMAILISASLQFVDEVEDMQ